MAGTKAGGEKSRDKMLARDPDYYRKLKAKQKNNPGGSFRDPAVAAEAGRKGGAAPRRRKTE